MTDQKYKDLMNGGWSYPKKESTDPEEVKKVVDKYLTDNKIDSETINKKITDGVSKIVADAPEDFDTLKEMSDWISQHSDSAAAMNSDILDNKSGIESLQKDKANATDVETLSGEVENNTNAISEIKANITTNIYNLNDVVKGKWIRNKNGSAGDSTSWAYLPLKVKGLKTVTISALGGTASWNKHYFNDNNGTTIEYNNSQVTVNVPSDATILYVNIYSEYTDINSIKITTESVGEIVSAINERTTLNVRLKLEQGDLDDNGLPVSSTEYKRTINYIKVKPNTEYTILRSNNYNLYVFGFQSKGIAVTDGTGTTNKFLVYNTTETNVCFTTTSTTQYIKVVVKNLDLSEKITIDASNSIGETVSDNANNVVQINDNVKHLKFNTICGGKNIFDKVVDEANCYYSPTNARVSNSNWDTYILNIESGKTYVVSGVSTVSTSIGFLAFNGDTFLSSLCLYTNEKFTTPSNCNKLKISVRKTEVDNFMIEEGTVATTYESYIPYSVNTLCEKIGDLSDYGLNNVFDGELVNGYHDWSNGNFVDNTTVVEIKNAISVNNGDTVSVKTEQVFKYICCVFFNNETYVSGNYVENKNECAFMIPSGVNRVYVYFSKGATITPSTAGHIGIYINNQIDVVKNGKEDKYTLELNYITKCVNFENVVNTDEYFEAMVFDRSDKKKYIKVSGYRPSENDEENEISYINLGSKTLNIVGSNNQVIMFSGGSEVYDAYIKAIR